VPPFVIPIVQAIAAAFTIDSLRGALRRRVPRPGPPPLGWSGPITPPVPPRGRVYPIERRPVAADRRV
jgi:hypothetical protein